MEGWGNGRRGEAYEVGYCNVSWVIAGRVTELLAKEFFGFFFPIGSGGWRTGAEQGHQ